MIRPVCCERQTVLVRALVGGEILLLVEMILALHAAMPGCTPPRAAVLLVPFAAIAFQLGLAAVAGTREDGNAA